MRWDRYLWCWINRILTRTALVCQTRPPRLTPSRPTREPPKPTPADPRHKIRLLPSLELARCTVCGKVSPRLVRLAAVPSPFSSVEGLQVALEVKLLLKRSRNSRGSRRATMNQTQHQRWAYRSAGLQALIESTAHNKKRR